jgi:hypothetical protein
MIEPVETFHGNRVKEVSAHLSVCIYAFTFTPAGTLFAWHVGGDS